MKQRKPLRRTELKRGTSELKRTEFKRGSSTLKSSKPNGPVKARSESTHIPEPIRLAAYGRDEWRCMCCGIYIPDSSRRWGLQHRRPRKAGGSKFLHTMANLVLLCGWTVDPGTCTERIELLDRLWATAEGWLVPDGVAPEEWRVRRWTEDGPQWMQPGDIWVPAAPHPRQIELGAVA